MYYRSQRNNRRAVSGRPGFNRARPSKGNSRKENIHPSKFIKAAKPISETVYTPTHSFADFPIDELLQANITAKGFMVPSPIQDMAIPAGLAGEDIIGIANTGTGKTVAFAIPMLQKLLTQRDAYALIMAPTRELAQQIEAECRTLARGSSVKSAVLIGGAPMGRQLRDLSFRPRLVIGTPGRIKDHLERGSLKLANFNIVVLDEVDRMLDMGFINDMRTILARLAEARQSFFFSATVDGRLNTLIQTFTHNPTTISVKTGDTCDAVEQNVITYGSHTDKIERLHELLIGNKGLMKALVFDETKRGVERLSKELLARGFRADAIHGGKSQGQRQRALSRFKANQVTILVATDVAARGIDVVDITHVINYSTPQTYDDYVHRIGRAGRAGRTGHALTFVPGNA